MRPEPDAGPACGTPRGYLAHLHYGQTIDEACRSAWRVFNIKPKLAPKITADRKRCTKCGQFKNILDFPLSGQGRRKTWCKPCKNAYNKENNARVQQLRAEGVLPPRRHRPRIRSASAEQAARAGGDHRGADSDDRAAARGDREAA